MELSLPAFKSRVGETFLSRRNEAGPKVLPKADSPDSYFTLLCQFNASSMARDSSLLEFQMQSLGVQKKSVLGRALDILSELK